MSYQTKEKQLSFKVTDELAKEVDQLADREDLRVADFVRKVFKYGMFKYRAAGRLWPLQQEMEEATVARQTGIAQKVYRRGTGSETETSQHTKKRIAS
jgi:hypothetical protein